MTDGLKYDQGKLRYDLLPVEAEREIVEVLTFGAAKYGDANWRKVTDARKRYLAAARRHLAAWMRGERLDSESGLPHLAHAATCVMFLQESDRPAAVHCGVGGCEDLDHVCHTCSRSELDGDEMPCLTCACHGVAGGLCAWETEDA